jgi:hypothetical protein
MGSAIDIHPTGTTDPFPAIVIKLNGMFIPGDQLFIQDIQHLQKGAVG